MSTTNIIITNNTAETVTLFLTLGATDHCVQDVKKIPFVKKFTWTPLQGSFTLGPGESTKAYAPPSGTGINGNISLDTPPLNCATDTYPLATNLAEFILNNGAQTGSPQETLDISGVAGTNAQYEFSMTGGGKWSATKAHPDVTSFKNLSIGNNLGQVGVYPYDCDIGIPTKNWTN